MLIGSNQDVNNIIYKYVLNSSKYKRYLVGKYLLEFFKINNDIFPISYLDKTLYNIRSYISESYLEDIRYLKGKTDLNIFWSRLYEFWYKSIFDYPILNKKFVMKSPEITAIGSKRTLFVNFPECCFRLNRSHRQVIKFLLNELGTTGTIDRILRLMIKGRFKRLNIENILKKYIREYIVCKMCKSSNTSLLEDILFLKCNECKCKYSVTPIK